MKSFLWLALLLALFDAPSWSQAQTATPPASDAPKFDQSDLKKARDLEHVEELWNKRFDWKEKDSSTSDIAAHLRQIMGNDVTVEVRGQDDNLSTFEISQARLGPTLCSILTLANAKAWAFPGRLLIAPQNLLTPEEANAAKVGMGGEWKESYTGGGSSWNAFNKFQQIALTLVGKDIKERFAAKGLKPLLPTPTPSPSIPSLAYELPLSDLSHTTKEILQNLADTEWEQTQVLRRLTHPNTPISPDKGPELDASTIVCFDDVQSTQLQLVLQKIDQEDAKKRKDINRWYVSKPQLIPAS